MALRGRLGVQRQVGAAGLEDAEQGRDEVERPLPHHGDARLRRQSPAQQPRGDAAGAGRQLSVRPLLVAMDDRDGVRRSRRLLGEEAVEGLLAMHDGRAAPLQNLAPLRLAEQGKVVKERSRRSAYPFEQVAEMPQQTLDRRPVEQVARVLQLAREPILAVEEREGEIELGGGALLAERFEREARHFQSAQADVLEGEHGLEQRVARQVAPRLQLLHQPLKGEILMLEGCERRPPYL